MSKFNVGDKVKIRKDSKYYRGHEENPRDTEGEVIEVKNYDGLHIRVKWLTGSLNHYNTSDLEFVLDKRTEIEQAMDVFEKYDICRISNGEYRSYKLDGNSLKNNREKFLEICFPSPKQTKLKELQEQIAELQNTANELEKEINA